MSTAALPASPPQIAAGSFELFQRLPLVANPLAGTRLSRRDDASPPLESVLSIALGETVWAGYDHVRGRVRAVAATDRPLAAFVFVKQKLSQRLAMFPQVDGILVNGMPALPMTLLAAKSSLVLTPGSHCIVTEKIVPYIGPPTAAMLANKLKCAACKLPLTPSTRIVEHRCGACYHYETTESHPHLPDEDRLGCGAHTRQCLCCRRPIVFQPHLAFDPNAES